VGFASDTRFLAEEIVATRRLLVTLIAADIQGQKLGSQEIKTLTEQVDATRQETTEGRIKAYLSR